MAQGLPRKIRIAFVTQALLSSVVISLVLLVVGLLIRHQLLDHRWRAEADAVFAAPAAQRQAQLPRATTTRAWFIPAGASESTLPAELAGRSPGLHDLNSGTPLDSAFIDRRAAGTFVARFSSGIVDQAILLTGLLDLVLTLAAIYLSSYLNYRTSARLVSPVSWLAEVVQRWDPRDPDGSMLTPASLPREAGTEVRHLASALGSMADRVGDFVARERDFTRDASHELRTPLTVIRVATDLMLADPQLTSRQRRSLARVQRAGRDMEAVIEAFLILAREADIAPQSEAFDVLDVVHEELERARALVAGRAVEIDLVEDASPRLYAPRRVLNVMLGNLLSNAAHFTDAGRITVRVDGDRIEVRDTGIGMSADVLERAFDPFWRADITREDGKGMGLSIVRRLGDRFGWPVSLSSVEGEGTLATIRFVG